MRRRPIAMALFPVLLGGLVLQPALAQGSGPVKLSLDECRSIALANNLDLVAARKDPAISEQQIQQALAQFDGSVEVGGTYREAEGDETIDETVMGMTTTFPGSSSSESITADASFGHLLKFGGSYSLTFNYRDVDFASTGIQQATGSLSQTTGFQTSDGFVLDLALPLLKGLGKEVTTEQVLLARSGRGISLEDLRLQAIQTVQSVEDAYWDVLAAREALRISRLALKRAEDLLALNKKKVEVGTLAPIEITEAEAGVASQVEAVIVAETLLENAEDVLLQLLAIPRHDARWERSLDLIDQPAFMPVDIDVDQAIATAVDQRPEMKNARQRLKDSELSERAAKNRKRHQLDLTARYEPSQEEELDFSFVLPTVPGMPGSDSLTISTDDNWQVGLRYTLPLRNRAAKADYAIARLNREKSDIALQNTEQGVRVDVRRAARQLESDVKRVEAARKNVELQEKKLDAEQKKFDNGMSTSFEVLTFQKDLADAELAEIRARLDYLKSSTEMERAKGTLLESRNLRVSQGE